METLKIPFKIFYKRKLEMMRGLMLGTVTSGHPTRTTLGNTLRVWSMIEYVKLKLNLTDE